MQARAWGCGSLRAQFRHSLDTLPCQIRISSSRLKIGVNPRSEPGALGGHVSYDARWPGVQHGVKQQVLVLDPRSHCIGYLCFTTDQGVDLLLIAHIACDNDPRFRGLATHCRWCKSQAGRRWLLKKAYFTHRQDRELEKSARGRSFIELTSDRWTRTPKERHYVQRAECACRPVPFSTSFWRWGVVEFCVARKEKSAGPRKIGSRLQASAKLLPKGPRAPAGPVVAAAKQCGSACLRLLAIFKHPDPCCCRCRAKRAGRRI
ncbi:hypothetical protein Micbo1qcDRAFT_14124 [Microdochium bolleyi]|uniref:Uncharacterized protein n=1 Tax=Microdochium bolleyi TaxID=196109 RepID=A0A136IW03_9PEZI|nr:hypothetical protein Micbo1qcDRAFT_14124 [Microdochium bolleyi]